MSKHLIESKIGIINNTSGSSLFKCNATTVVCTVDINNRNEMMRTEEYDHVVYDIKYKNVNKKRYDKYYKSIIEQILKEFVIEIDICKTIHCNMIIDSANNDTMFCAINALFLSLSQAGVPLKCSFYASSGFTNAEDFYIFSSLDQVIFYHGLCEMSSMTNEYSKYVKEVQDYALKKYLLIKQL